MNVGRMHFNMRVDSPYTLVTKNRIEEELLLYQVLTRNQILIWLARAKLYTVEMCIYRNEYHTKMEILLLRGNE